MIGRVRGELVEYRDGVALVEARGVAYEIEITAAAAERLPAAGEECVLSTHLVVRDDAHLLFGFDTSTERDVFRHLIRLAGVGPKLAMSLLSALGLRELAACVDNDDLARLTRVPGVGKKTAERLMLELKSRLPDLHLSSGIEVHVAAGAGDDDVLGALLALGYRPAEADAALAAARAQNSSEDAGALLRLALQHFAKQREAAG